MTFYGGLVDRVASLHYHLPIGGRLFANIHYLVNYTYILYVMYISTVNTACASTGNCFAIAQDLQYPMQDLFSKYD